MILFDISNKKDKNYFCKQLSNAIGKTLKNLQSGVCNIYANSNLICQHVAQKNGK
jgi:hypothetical protein